MFITESIQLIVAIDVLRYKETIILAVMCAVHDDSPSNHQLLSSLSITAASIIIVHETFVNIANETEVLVEYNNNTLS